MATYATWKAIALSMQIGAKHAPNR